MHAHLVQLDIAWEDRDANFTRVRQLLEGPRVRTGDLIVLPEMFDSGFSLNVETTADAEGRSAAFLADLARAHGAWVVGGLTVRSPDDPERGLNRCLLIDPDGREAARYDKVHPFTYGREGERFLGGRDVVAAGLGDAGPRLALTVCYDLRFPELFRAGLSHAAEVFTVIANWPIDRAAHWRALLIARAIENQAIVLGVNRCGTDPFLGYAGGSIAVDEQGRVLAEAGGGEQVLSVPLDQNRVRLWRERFPAWRDGAEWLWPRGQQPPRSAP